MRIAPLLVLWTVICGLCVPFAQACGPELMFQGVSHPCDDGAVDQVTADVIDAIEQEAINAIKQSFRRSGGYRGLKEGGEDDQRSLSGSHVCYMHECQPDLAWKDNRDYAHEQFCFIIGCPVQRTRNMMLSSKLKYIYDYVKAAGIELPNHCSRLSEAARTTLDKWAGSFLQLPETDPRHSCGLLFQSIDLTCSWECQ